MLRIRPPRTALTAALTLTLTTGAMAGPIVVEKLEIFASVTQTAVRFDPLPPINVGRIEAETWIRPGPFFLKDSPNLGNGIADADTTRPAPFSSLPIYTAARQTEIANAVGVSHSYDASAKSVFLEATTTWVATVHNTGATPEPVEFSFFLSGGGLSRWCVVCNAPGTVALVEARIEYDHAIKWQFGLRLPRIGFIGQDPLDIGVPGGVFIPASALDPSERIVMDAFHPDPFVIGTLDAGQSREVLYELSAKVTSVGSAYATAWLTDPFELGEFPGALPSSGFTINGESISALLGAAPAAPGVPEPGTLLLLLAGLGGFATAARRARRLG